MKHCINLSTVLTAGDSSDIEPKELCQEIQVLSGIIKDQNIEGTPRNIMNFLSTKNMIGSFPNLEISLQILLTLPVTVASGERSFSKLKLIKTYLRSSLSQERLAGLSLLAIENNILNHVNIDELISEFAKRKSRRVQF